MFKTIQIIPQIEEKMVYQKCVLEQKETRAVICEIYYFYDDISFIFHLNKQVLNNLLRDKFLNLTQIPK